jgi:DNA-3-methyladenine glycosylase
VSARVLSGVNALPQAFFDRDPRRVARELLGKLIVRSLGRQTLTARVVETEAYLGKNDPAAHSASGRTPRNAVIFGPPGFAYVYFIYGNHYCLNVSCLLDGVAGGVLFRALEPVTGMASMAKARCLDELLSPQLTNGPGKLTEALSITRAENGLDLTDPTGPLYLAEDNFPNPRVVTTTRIDITKAAHLKLRYFIHGNRFVSKR